jgi:Mg2+-importing ATPase
VVSASLILLVVRSRQHIFSSRPSRRLILATLGIVLVAAVLPYLPFADFLGFVSLPLVYLVVTAAIVALYIAAAELTKRFFYRRFDRVPAVAS